MEQISFSDADYAANKKVTRCPYACQSRPSIHLTQHWQHWSTPV
jgi:hypothetical protein